MLTHSYLLKQRALATQFTANMELLEPELPRVMRVTPARVTLEVVVEPPHVVSLCMLM